MATLPGENEKVYPCEICGRNFVSNSLLKHELVCRKMAKEKRKVFDSGKQRATGSDITIDNVLNARKEREKLGGMFPRPKTSWREKHEAFVNAMSASKQADFPTHINAPSVPKMPPPKDCIKCKCCNRSFNEMAAERHIPFCKTQQEKRGPIKVQKIRSRQSNITVVGSEADDCNRLNNTRLNHNSRMISKKSNSQRAISERGLSFSSQRSESLQRSNANNSTGNDRRRERSSSRIDSHRSNSKEKKSIPMSKQLSHTRKSGGTETIRKK